MPTRPHTGRLVSLLLLVATTAALLAGCSLSTPLCGEGDALVAAGQPARALEVYTRAQVQGDGCAEEGLETASTNQRRAVEEAVRGEAAERAGDLPTATAAYQAALALDVTNALAITGLAQLGQPEPIPPPPVAAPPPSRSWWAGPWPYLLGSVLISALLAGAVLWLVRSRLGTLKSKATRSNNLLNVMELDLLANQGRLKQLESHTRTGRELINTLEQNTLAHTQTIASLRRELAALRDADAETDRECVRLDRALRRQKERSDQLTKLIDLFAETQAEPTSETVVRFERRPLAGAPANEGGIDDEKTAGTEGVAYADSAISAGAKQVEVNVFAIRIGHGQGGQEQLVVQRVVEPVAEPGDAGNADLFAPYDEVPLTEHEPGPVEQAAADSMVDPAWERVEDFWVTPDYQGLAAGANLVKSVEDGWHDLVLGKPAEYVALGAGFSPASADVMEAIAAKASLPGDSTFKDVRRLVQCSGIVLGVVSGAAPLANACVSSLAHDLLAELTVKAFRTAIDHVLAPVDHEIRPIPANELGPDGARAEQLHRNLVDAAPWQRAHELEMQKLEAQRLEVERLEVERLEVERLDLERLDMERSEVQRLEAPRLETWLDGPSL